MLERVEQRGDFLRAGSGTGAEAGRGARKPGPRSREQLVDLATSTLEVELALPAGSISEHVRFKEDLAMDSLDAINLLVTIEDASGLVIPDAAVRELETVGDLIDYVANRLDIAT